MKTVEVGFTGVAQVIAGQKKISIQLADQASYADLVQILAKLFPKLVGVLISTDERSLLSGNLFSRDNEQPIMPDEMTGVPQDRERLIILYFIVGG